MSVAAADNALVTLAEIKDWLGLSASTDDDFLQRAINDWSDTVETRLGRHIKSQEHEDERHDGGRLSALLRNTPITSISEITVDDGALGTSDYTFDGNTGIIRLVSGRPFGGGPGSILVTYTGGYDTTPGDLKQAAKKLVAIEYYLSGHGRKALAKRGESDGHGSVTYNVTERDQHRIMVSLEMRYGRR
jgi:hypothetical protein